MNFILFFRNLYPRIQGMIERFLSQKLKNSLQKIPAVALLGPRQVGKTTLAQSMMTSFKSLYLDLESPADLVKLNDPLLFLSQYSDQLIIVDEIQLQPELFKVLRGMIDNNRQKGKKGLQFLLLGSASIDLLRQSSESLAGRISYLDMAGLNALEVPFQQVADQQKLWLRGGFPESYLTSSDIESMEWLEMLIRTYLERDIPQFGFRIPAIRLRRLWTMLAHLQGETVNYSKLAGNFEVDSKTISHYCDLLTDLLLLRRLNPWHENTKKRLIKSPRYYIRDTGILHRLLGIGSYQDLVSHPVLGKSWEGLVIENILSLLPSTTQAYYYRTSSGAEIDLILKISSQETWAIEIKYGTAPKIKTSFHESAREIQASKKFVIYSGADEFPLAKDTTVLSLFNFMIQLKEALSL